MNPLTPLRDRFLLNERFSAVVNAVIVVVMMTCVAIVATLVGQRLAPGWRSDYLVGACSLAALEAVLSARVAARRGLPVWNGVAYRITELIFILVAVKLFLYAHYGFSRLLADLPRWQKDFSTFMEGEYFVASLLVVGVWTLSGMLADTLLQMEGDVELLERDIIMENSRMAVRRRLAVEIFGIGAGLLFMTAVIRGDLNVIGVSLPALQNSLFSVLLYFVLGLILFSQGHFAVLRAIWSAERIQIGTNMAVRWTVYSVGLIVAVGLLVSFLPTRYSIGLLGALAYLLNALMFIILSLETLVVALISILIAWLQSLLFGRPPAAPPGPLSLPTPDLAPTAGPGLGPAPWLEVVKSLFFWAVFLGVLGYSLYYYFRQRKEIVAFLRRFPLWRWLVRGGQSMWGGVKELNQMLAAAVKDGLRRLRATTQSTEPWRYLSLRSLPPRDRVRFFYLAFVRRSGESGLPRRPSQTPYEYENDLNTTLPEVDDDVAALTDAFIEARYSQHTIPAQTVQAIRKHWDQIRKALRERQGKG